MKPQHKILILCCGFFFKTAAQNFVPNGSFENYSTCPSNFSQVNKAVPWYDPTGATSDYYNACDTGYVNVPYCSGGYQIAKTGVAYAGLWALNGFGDGTREYIQVQLNSILTRDSCYLVEFYCNLDNHTGYTIKSLGAYLSNGPVNNVGPGSVMSYTPQIISTSFLTDTINWMHVSGYYKAIGGEQYITIGNFKPFNLGDTLQIGGSSYDGSYYFIDDVTVRKVSNCDTTTAVLEYTNHIGFKLYPNPSNGQIEINYHLNASDKAELLVYNAMGKLISTYQIDSVAKQSTAIDLQLSEGIYFCRIKVNGRIVKIEKLVVVK